MEVRTAEVAELVLAQSLGPDPPGNCLDRPADFHECVGADPVSLSLD